MVEQGGGQGDAKNTTQGGRGRERRERRGDKDRISKMKQTRCSDKKYAKK